MYQPIDDSVLIKKWKKVIDCPICNEKALKKINYDDLCPKCKKYFFPDYGIHK